MSIYLIGLSLFRNLFFGVANLPSCFTMKKLIFHLKFLTFFYAYSTNLSLADTFDWIKISPQIRIEELDSDLFPSDFSKEMAQKLLNHSASISPESITIFNLKNEILALFPCRFDVLRWSGADWQNEYKGNFAGFNCDPHFFVKDDVLYSLGNINSREVHSTLLSFDFVSGEWIHHIVENMPVNFRSDLAFLTTDLLMSFELKDSQKSQNWRTGFYLDFSEKTWKNLKIKAPSQFFHASHWAHFFELADFTLLFATSFPGKTNWLIVEKSNQTIHLPSQKSSLKSLDYSVVIAQKNTIMLLDQKGESFLMDVDEHFQKSKQVGEIFTDQPIKITGSGFRNLTSVFLIGGSFFMLLFLWLSKRKPSNQNSAGFHQPKSGLKLNDIYSHVSSFQGQSIAVEDLDSILGLEKIANLDSRRVTRAKWIRSINSQSFDENGHELILRTRSVEDNRIIIYSIHKMNPENFMFQEKLKKYNFSYLEIYL